jgi:hypothetical protein
MYVSRGKHSLQLNGIKKTFFVDYNLLDNLCNVSIEK